MLGDVPVELSIAVDIVLRVAGARHELVGREIVVHVVDPDDEVVLAKLIAEQRMYYMLSVAIVVVVGTSAVWQKVGLVILVEGVGDFQSPAPPKDISALQPSAVALEVIVVGVALARSEEVAAPACECQLVSSTPRQPFLHVIGLLTIETAQVGVIIQYRLIVGQPLRLLQQFLGNLLGRVWLGQVDGVNLGVLEIRLGVPFCRVEREAGPVAPLMAEGVVTGVYVGRPRL